MLAKFKLSKILRILPFLSLILFSCQGRTFEDKIVDKIKDSCKEFPCSIRIGEITDFEWNKLYVFNYGASPSQIEKVVGRYVPENTKFTRKIIFTNKGKIVHYEELQTNVEATINNQVYFDDTVEKGYEIYSVNNANFKAQKYSEGKIIYYQLNQID